MKTRTPVFIRSLILALVGLCAVAPAVLAQDVCPRPPGVAEIKPPSVTAADVEANPTPENLQRFALAARDFIPTGITNLDELAYRTCLSRLEGGPWFAGSTYMVILTLNSRLLAHLKNMMFGGRLLNQRVFNAVLVALGFDTTDPSALAAALAKTAQDGVFPKADGGPVSEGGYAVGYVSALGRLPYILFVGFDLGETHLVQEVIDHATPSITAREVMDRPTLKRFVDEAATYAASFTAVGGQDIRLSLRDPNGPWRHGPTYLFMMDRTGYTLFHGAFPNKYEYQIPTNTLRDAVTGQLILPQIIAAAQRPGGGFVEYHFDNPDDDTDSVEVPKVTYARLTTLPFVGRDGTQHKFQVIIGAGIYGDPEVMAAPCITACLESPTPGVLTPHSGISMVYGWVCEAEEVVIEFNGTDRFPAGYGTAREDTQDTCGDTNNGFGLLFNWNRLGTGEHTVRALADGEEFGRARFRVTTLGEELVRDVRHTARIADFPRAGQTVTVEWQEAVQGFVITGVE